MRAMIAAVFLLFVFANVARGQTFAAASAAADRGGDERERFSVQAAAGPTLRGGGHALSASFGYAPASRLELIVSVERIHLPFEVTPLPRGVSTTRGGTMTFVSGELRVAFLPPERVWPFALAGVGAGVSRPTVNDQFPDVVKNDLRVLYVGGGVRVALGGGVGVWGDARAMLALEGNDGVMAVWPVRAGLTWRF